jgi:hypothetical protein
VFWTCIETTDPYANDFFNSLGCSRKLANFVALRTYLLLTRE